VAIGSFWTNIHSYRSGRGALIKELKGNSGIAALLDFISLFSLQHLFLSARDAQSLR
jgi:hypothetical protein